MPLHINLLHEEQEQELQRRRDPIKIGLMVILFIAVIMVGYYMQQLQSLSAVKSQRTLLESQWAQLEPEAAAAALEQARLEGIIASSEALTTFASGRFYMAPVFESITGLVPPTIQVRAFALSALKRENRIEGSIQGVAASADPRRHADEFREQLSTTLTRHVFASTLAITSLEDENREIEFNEQKLRAARFDFEIRGTIVEPAPTPAPSPTGTRR